MSENHNGSDNLSTQGSPSSGLRVRAEDSLPPVEPPSAGFLLQLFVVPGVIVAVIVGLTLFFNALTSSQPDPKHYVRQIASGRVNSWQAAHDLAVELQRNPAWRTDATMVRDLADLLSKQLKNKMPGNEALARAHVEQISYLCRILLGCQMSAESRQALLDALAYDHGEPDRDVYVRAAALEAVSLEIGALQDKDFASQLETRMIEMSRDESPLVRLRSAFALGLFKTSSDALLSRLRMMLIDGKDDVRYNAATSLARHGDAACLPVLEEMLELNEPGSAEANSGSSTTAPGAVMLSKESAKDRNTRETREVMVLEAAIGAAAALAKLSPQSEWDGVKGKLLNIQASQERLPPGARDHLTAQASALLKLLDSSAAKSPPGSSTLPEEEAGKST